MQNTCCTFISATGAVHTIRIQVSMHMKKNIEMSNVVRASVCVNICVYVCITVCTYECMYAHTNVCMHV